MKRGVPVWVALQLFAVGCAGLTEELAVIRGNVSYRQRVAMPSDAVVEIRLVDVTSEGNEPPVIASCTVERPGAVPVAYELAYRPSSLKPGHRHAVQARILSKGSPWMVTGTVNHVMDFGRIARADVTLVPAPRVR